MLFLKRTPRRVLVVYLIAYYFRITSAYIHVRIARVSECVFRWRISDRVLNWYLHLYLGSCIGDVYYERIRRVLPMRIDRAVFQLYHRLYLWSFVMRLRMCW